MCIRIRSTIIEDIAFYSNLFITTNYNKDLTSRFDYKNSCEHYGTQYNRADYYQSIRLSTYYRNEINESERSEYHQITTGVTVPQRNIKKYKERYLVESINTWVNKRLENLLTASEIYLDCVRTYSTTPIEFLEPEMDSNFTQGEMIVNKDYTLTRDFEYQIYEGLILIYTLPFGLTTDCELVNASMYFNNDIILGIGNITLFDSSNTALMTFNQSEMVVVGSQLNITTDISGVITDIDNYYFHVDSTLILADFDEFYEGINDSNTWSFEISDGEYNSEEYNENEYLTGCPEEPSMDNRTVLAYNFNETSGTTAIDSSLNGLDGTIVNASINETGIVDKCYLFNGGGATDEYVDVSDSDLLSFTDGTNDIPFSISLWIKPENNFGAILNKYNTTDGYEYRMFMQSGILQFFIYSENTTTNRLGVADNVSLVLDVWNHVAVTWDLTDLKMKVNNVDASFAQSETGTYVKMNNTNSILRLAQESDNDSGSARFEGNIDILRIFRDYVLTETDITTLYNSGSGLEN